MLIDGDFDHNVPQGPRSSGLSDVYVSIRDALWLADLPVESTIEVEIGVALAAASDDVIESFVTRSLTDPFVDGPSFRLLRTGGLPLVASLRVADEPALQTIWLHDRGGTTVAPDETIHAAGTVALTGPLIGWDGSPFDGGLAWVVSIEDVVNREPLEVAPVPGLERTEMAVDADDRFSAVLEVPASYVGSRLKVHFAYVVFDALYPDGRGYRYLATADFVVDDVP